MDVRRDVIERLRNGSVDYYVTGSEAMAVHGIAFRATNDIDIVLGISSTEYARRIPPLFEPDYLVNDLLRAEERWLGGAISTLGIGKADFILRDPGGWATNAFGRRVEIDDPGLGLVLASGVEDLIIAKLEWSQGRLDSLQVRDVVRIIQMIPTLDWTYVQQQTASMGLGDLLAEARRRA
jgi:hypothetical protein